MYTDLTKRIYSAIKNVDKLPRLIIKYGALFFLFLFALGTGMVIYNRIHLNYDPYFEFIATSVIKTSFTVLAEAVIGGLLIDYIFKTK